MIPTAYDTPLTGLDWLEYYPKHRVYHPGCDFNKGRGNQDCGQEVKAPKSGFIEFVWNSAWNSGGLGKLIIMYHSDGTFTRYAHLQSIAVKKGQEVKEGTVIGYLGNTGTTYCHLHFEVFNEDCAIIQKNHWRPWRWYPSGKSKAWVQQHYLNPWVWLKQESSEGVPKWAIPSVTWCRAQGLIKNFKDDKINRYEVALILRRFHDKFIK